jgi:hypothetical protein
VSEDRLSSNPSLSHGDLPGLLPQLFGLMGGISVWMVAVITAYPMVRIACVAEQPLLVHLVRWTAMVVALAALLTARRVHRRGQQVDVGGAGAAVGRNVRLVGFAGVLVSATGLLLLIVEDLAAWVINPCL